MKIKTLLLSSLLIGCVTTKQTWEDKKEELTSKIRADFISGLPEEVIKDPLLKPVLEQYPKCLIERAVLPFLKNCPLPENNEDLFPQIKICLAKEDQTKIARNINICLVIVQKYVLDKMEQMENLR